MSEIIWVLEYLDDIDADFLRFYGIDLSQDDPVASARFFKLAYRLPAYQGVISARIDQEREAAKTISPSRELRNGTATEVPIEAMSEFIEMR